MTTYQQFNQESQQKPSDVEKLYIQLQGTFGGNTPWNNLDLHAQSVFVQSVNNTRAICSLGG